MGSCYRRMRWFKMIPGGDSVTIDAVTPELAQLRSLSWHLRRPRRPLRHRSAPAAKSDQWPCSQVPQCHSNGFTAGAGAGRRCARTEHGTVEATPVAVPSGSESTASWIKVGKSWHHFQTSWVQALLRRIWNDRTRAQKTPKFQGKYVTREAVAGTSLVEVLFWSLSCFPCCDVSWWLRRLRLLSSLLLSSQSLLSIDHDLLTYHTVNILVIFDPSICAIARPSGTREILQTVTTRSQTTGQELTAWPRTYVFFHWIPHVLKLKLCFTTSPAQILQENILKQRRASGVVVNPFLGLLGGTVATCSYSFSHMVWALEW